MLTDARLAEIEQRLKERQEYRRHIPRGPYFYDSLGYVHNEDANQRTRSATQRRAGVLVRSDDWFRSVKMDERLTTADKQIGADLGQYVSLVCDHDVEQDLADVIEELHRLRSA